MTENNHKIFNKILILLPFIDVITSFTVRNFNMPVTLGIVVKALILLYFLVYVFFITGSKYKSISKKYIIILGIYFVLYFAMKTVLIKEGFLFTEISYLAKFAFFPVMFFAFLCFYNDSGFDKKEINKVLFITIILYALLLFIPFITNTAYNTYTNKKHGFVGWFFSGNEISSIVTLLFPFIYKLMDNKRILGFVLILPVIYILSRIGTKVSFFGLVIVGFLMLLRKLLEDKKLTKDVLAYFLVFISVISIMYNGYSLNNLEKNLENERKEHRKFQINYDSKWVKLQTLALALLSNRDEYLLDTMDIYKENYDLYTFLFGLGFSDTSLINNDRVEKLVEIDIIDIYYHMGILACALIVFPFLYLWFTTIRYLLRNKINAEMIFYNLMVLLSLAISCISGHILIGPAVSIYVALYMAYAMNEAGAFRKKNIDSKKVEILSLHLGFGGAERSTISIANMLSKEYDVEILTLYKTVDTIPYLLNENVKVKYLCNYVPRKKEFIKAIKHFRLIKAFKIGIESIKILHLKYINLRNVVSYSNAKYVISTRESFSEILSNYGRVNAKKIGIEHNFDISEKFINRVNKKLKNLDLFVTVSKTAYEVYKHTLNINVKCIPNSVDYEYTAKSKLNKSLISVGRLEKEKGMLELIDVFKLVHEKDKRIKLEIYGDGSEKNAIENKIKKYELEKYVVMHGFKASDEINESYKKAGLYVMCSKKESFGIVILEAMSSGIPVIAYENITGAKELIKNNKNGFLIPNRDKKLMADKIIEYMNKKDKKKYQDEAIKTSNLYTFETVQKRWLKEISEL